MDEIVGLLGLEEARPRPAPTGFDGKNKYSDAVRDLIKTYHDLNPTTIDELYEEPSPLEFMRYVSRNRPFIVRRGASSFRACQKWSADYLTATMGDSPVNVALTPHGNADSILPSPTITTTAIDRTDNNHLLFVKPHETISPFTTVLHQIQSQETRGETFRGPTRYAQTQNDNLRNEYAELFSDVPTSIPFARIALQRDPDAINFWLGNSHSVTALHKDNYENIYVQVLGKKHFVLLPPVESACVNEKSVLAATYGPRDEGSEREDDGLVVRIDEPREYVPFATWDPDGPDERATEFSRLSSPLRVTLDEGDMLYLPALWYHKVSQSCSEEGICCAVNYWYDLEFSGSFWAMSTFVRGVGLLAMQQQGEVEVTDTERRNELQRTEQH